MLEFVLDEKSRKKMEENTERWRAKHFPQHTPTTADPYSEIDINKLRWWADHQHVIKELKERIN